MDKQVWLIMNPIKNVFLMTSFIKEVMVGTQKPELLPKSNPYSVFRGIDHIGITVPDMDEAIRFLKNAFGAEVIYSLVGKDDKPREGKHVDDTLALPKSAKIVRQTLMRLGNGPSLELFQFSNVSQKPSHMLQDFGLQHFTVYVDDMEKAMEIVTKAGGKPYYKPHKPHGPEGAKGSLGVYIQPPWGGIIEMFKYDKIDYPKNTKVQRWTPPPRVSQ